MEPNTNAKKTSTKKTKAPVDATSAAVTPAPVVQKPKLKHSELVVAIVATAAASAEALRTSAEGQKARFEETKAEADKRAYQRLECHAKMNTKISGMSAEAVAYLARLGVDPDTFVDQSRELKKRAIQVCEAIAHNNIALLEEGKYHQATLAGIRLIVAKQAQGEFTFLSLKREMQHDTLTQAQYFVRFLKYFGAGDGKKDTFTVNRENRLIKDFAKLLGVEMKEAEAPASA